MDLNNKIQWKFSDSIFGWTLIWPWNIQNLWRVPNSPITKLFWDFLFTVFQKLECFTFNQPKSINNSYHLCNLYSFSQLSYFFPKTLNQFIEKWQNVKATSFLFRMFHLKVFSLNEIKIIERWRQLNILVTSN